MVTFRNNNSNRRPPFRGSNEGSKFSNNNNFQRNIPGRNNHNAVKLIEKYNDLAREALANEDKILSENYFQHADHFTRVQNEQESIRVSRINAPPTEPVKPIKDLIENEKPIIDEKEKIKKIKAEVEVDKRVVKTKEKKSATS